VGQTALCSAQPYAFRARRSCAIESGLRKAAVLTIPAAFTDSGNPLAPTFAHGGRLSRKRHLMAPKPRDKFIFWVERISAYEQCELGNSLCIAQSALLWATCRQYVYR